MAKSRAKRKAERTVPQRIASVASLSLPAPLQKVLGNRIAAFIFVLLVPALLATGLATVTWQNGMPKFSINKEKAEQAKVMTVEKIQELRDETFEAAPDGRPLSGLRDRFDMHR